MKNSMHLLFLLVFAAAVTTSCNKSNDDDDSIPETTFELEVSGAETNSFDITIPASQPHTDFTIIGGHSSVANLMTLNFRQLPTGWGLVIAVTASSISTGTFQSVEAQGSISSYSDNSGADPYSYLSTTFEVNVTKAREFANATGITVYYLDGTFTGTLASPGDPTQTVTVSGSFSGVPVSSQ